MRVRREVCSIPSRLASETWDAIVELIAGPNSVDVEQLKSASGVLASVITAEHPSTKAIVVEGVGPQLRVYCVYGMKAIEEEKKLDPLTWNPTAGDWTMHVPCDRENIAWVRAALAKLSPRIQVFDVADQERAAPEETTGRETGKTVTIDWDFKG